MANLSDETWNSIGIKSKFTIITACVLIFFGMLLSVAGFLVSPIGDISTAVLTIFAECLIWGGSAYGITMYMKANDKKIAEVIGDKLSSFKNEKGDNHDEEQ